MIQTAASCRVASVGLSTSCELRRRPLCFAALFACCTLLACLVHAVCSEPVHSHRHLSCAVGIQPTHLALRWMIGHDGHALFVWHRRAPAWVTAVRGFAKPLHALSCYYAKILFALRRTGYTPRATLGATATHL